MPSGATTSLPRLVPRDHVADRPEHERAGDDLERIEGGDGHRGRRRRASGVASGHSSRLAERRQLGHVRALLVTEAERNREGREHRDRRVDVAPLLDAREVVDAHAGERGDLLAPGAPGVRRRAAVDESDVGRMQRLHGERAGTHPGPTVRSPLQCAAPRPIHPGPSTPRITMPGPKGAAPAFLASSDRERTIGAMTTTTQTTTTPTTTTPTTTTSTTTTPTTTTPTTTTPTHHPDAVVLCSSPAPGGSTSPTRPSASRCATSACRRSAAASTNSTSTW